MAVKRSGELLEQKYISVAEHDTNLARLAKAGKSLVRIRLTERQPATAWNLAAPQEYGFYSNVNPQVDHPRWSQARERRLGEGLFSPRRPTLPFNGYAEQVAGLYAGMDLRRDF